MEKYDNPLIDQPGTSQRFEESIKKVQESEIAEMINKESLKESSYEQEQYEDNESLPYQSEQL